tara:strand:- start:25650 stop:26312 length:663 start_codon:yes stop_codon:yes gene_type:complete
MGQALADVVQQQSDLALCGIWRRGEDLGALLSNADVLIDFSLPDALESILAEVQARSVPLVCGVSGLNEMQMQRLRDASEVVPLVYDRNMSLGIAVLERSVREAAASLGQDFSVAVSEVHHVHKKDSPSGTALKLGEAIAAARGENGTGSVSFAAERRGEVPGEHEVVMRSATESVVFAHRVTTRQVFVDGALRAARWVVAQTAGLYSMQNVLFGDAPKP